VTSSAVFQRAASIFLRLRSPDDRAASGTFEKPIGRPWAEAGKEGNEGRCSAKLSRCRPRMGMVLPAIKTTK
jgi:hypothetical protein